MADGTLKVGTITTSSGSGTITLGQSGETIALGATTNNLLTPAFHAYIGSDQTGISDATDTKLQINTEDYDTDNCYDSSTNYRFTPTVAGKYFVYSVCEIFCTSGQVNQGYLKFYFNGSELSNSNTYWNLYDGSNGAQFIAPYVARVITFNGTSDYVEMYGHLDGNTNVTNAKFGTKTFFGAYRII
tara:strand:- start:55 stop:612 length:558 start_codon:yes stop_codon:yes gene_type:complete